MGFGKYLKSEMNEWCMESGEFQTGGGETWDECIQTNVME